ncbi:MAG: PIG-L deacetylase family protein [Candidatus Bathyarchaeia archaeon]
MRILAFIAHPDYTELFFGGTVVKYAMRGDEVYIVSVSPGEMGHPTIPPEELANIRKEELRSAAKIEGIKEARVLNFKDTEISNTPELRLTMMKIIREIKPDIVITHWPKDAHPDLRETGQAAIDACLLAYLGSIKTEHPPHVVKKVYTFGVPSSSIDFKPTVFIEITQVIDKKIEAAKCHRSMIESFAEGSVETWVSGILGENRYWGREAGVMYAEAFAEVNIHALGRRALDYLPL